MYLRSLVLRLRLETGAETGLRTVLETRTGMTNLSQANYLSQAEPGVAYCQPDPQPNLSTTSTSTNLSPATRTSPAEPQFRVNPNQPNLNHPVPDPNDTTASTTAYGGARPKERRKNFVGSTKKP